MLSYATQEILHTRDTQEITQDTWQTTQNSYFFIDEWRNYKSEYDSLDDFLSNEFENLLDDLNMVMIYNEKYNRWDEIYNSDQFISFVKNTEYYDTFNEE